jgi:hypothetical protein
LKLIWQSFHMRERGKVTKEIGEDKRVVKYNGQTTTYARLHSE